MRPLAALFLASMVLLCSADQDRGNRATRLCGDIPNGISRPFAYSQLCVTDPDRMLVFGAGMNGYTVSDSNSNGVLDFGERIGDLLPLVPSSAYLYGYDPSNRIRQALRNVNASMAFTGSNISTDLVYLSAKFSFLDIEDVVAGLTRQQRKDAFNQWRGTLNAILREFIPEPLPLPARTLEGTYQLVDLDTVELTPVWLARRDAARVFESRRN